MEVWKDIPGYEGFYQASSIGRIKRLGNEKIRKQHLNPNGYLEVVLCVNSSLKTFRAHQLVAMAFLNHTPCGNKKVVNHKNFNRTDNRLENLEVITNRENTNKKHIKDTSDFVGVHWRKDINKWRSQITHNNKLIRLGVFDCEKEASQYYQNALKAIKNGEEIKIKKSKKEQEKTVQPRKL